MFYTLSLISFIICIVFGEFLFSVIRHKRDVHTAPNTRSASSQSHITNELLSFRCYLHRYKPAYRPI